MKILFVTISSFLFITVLLSFVSCSNDTHTVFLIHAPPFFECQHGISLENSLYSVLKSLALYSNKQYTYQCIDSQNSFYSDNLDWAQYPYDFIIAHSLDSDFLKNRQASQVLYQVKMAFLVPKLKNYPFNTCFWMFLLFAIITCLIFNSVATIHFVLTRKFQSNFFQQINGMVFIKIFRINSINNNKIKSVYRLMLSFTILITTIILFISYCKINKNSYIQDQAVVAKKYFFPTLLQQTPFKFLTPISNSYDMNNIMNEYAGGSSIIFGDLVTLSSIDFDPEDFNIVIENNVIELSFVIMFGPEIDSSTIREYNAIIVDFSQYFWKESKKNKIFYEKLYKNQSIDQRKRLFFICLLYGIAFMLLKALQVLYTKCKANCLNALKNKNPSLANKLLEHLSLEVQFSYQYLSTFIVFLTYQKLHKKLKILYKYRKEQDKLLEGRKKKLNTQQKKSINRLKLFLRSYHQINYQSKDITQSAKQFKNILFKKINTIMPEDKPKQQISNAIKSIYRTIIIHWINQHIVLDHQPNVNELDDFQHLDCSEKYLKLHDLYKIKIFRVLNQAYGKKILKFGGKRIGGTQRLCRHFWKHEKNIHSFIVELVHQMENKLNLINSSSSNSHHKAHLQTEQKKYRLRKKVIKNRLDQPKRVLSSSINLKPNINPVSQVNLLPQFKTHGIKFQLQFIKKININI